MATVAAHQRFTLIELPAASPAATFAEEVRAGLAAQPKRLPCRFFYDREGSLLFEAICELPEYYLTRTERGILERQADEIVAPFPKQVSLVELGSGSAAKTRLLIEAFLHRGVAVRYVPVDISRSMLEQSSLALLREYATLEILALAAEYRDGLRYLGGKRQADSCPEFAPPFPVANRVDELGPEETDRPKLILWLGSNIGNLERDEAAAFLSQTRETMAASDRLLVGVDLRKDRAVLEPAYDDALGVTAQFNINLLARINRELGGEFDLAAFRHRAVYDEELGRIEMYLVSMCVQRVAIERLGLTVHFAAGEAIHTENSYKYSLGEIDAVATAAGLQIERQWLDPARRFSANLLARAGAPPRR